MTLEQNLRRTGRWLFRWRSYLPLLLLAITLPALSGFHYPLGSHYLDHAWDLFCLFISFIGLGILAYAVGHVPKGTSGRNTRGQVADVLNVSGLYSVCRNPLYLGNFFMGLGPMLFVRQYWLLLVYASLFWLYYERIIFAEEEFLRRKFGKVYEEYCRRTPVFVPRISLWRPPALPFSFRTVLKREYSGLFGLLSTFMLLETIGEYVVNQRLVVDKLWAVIFIVGAVIYIVLRTLKKHTTLLDVPGR